MDKMGTGRNCGKSKKSHTVNELNKPQRKELLPAFFIIMAGNNYYCHEHIV